MVLTMFVLKYIFLKLQDIEKETVFGFCRDRLPLIYTTGISVGT